MIITPDKARILLNNILGDYNDETIMNGSQELDEIVLELKGIIRESERKYYFICPICDKQFNSENEKCPLCFTKSVKRYI